MRLFKTSDYIRCNLKRLGARNMKIAGKHQWNRDTFAMVSGHFLQRRAVTVGEQHSVVIAAAVPPNARHMNNIFAGESKRRRYDGFSDAASPYFFTSGQKLFSIRRGKMALQIPGHGLRSELAALTMASVSIFVISPSTKRIRSLLSHNNSANEITRRADSRSKQRIGHLRQRVVHILHFAAA